ncbi:hypothetical protein D6827_00085 [Candidatus Parcubacteria bacterium]|nr:MAG: hypothetical protein D6827_00085 [Candidatus Parcubacteria bacterium]
MPFNGRQLTIDWKATTLVGVRTRGITMNNQLVDVTSDDSNGWRQLLANPGVKSISVQVTFVYDDETLIAEFFNAAATGETLQVNLPSSLTTPGNFSGTFILESVEQNGEHDGELIATATFQSTGAVTYTASA